MFFTPGDLAIPRRTAHRTWQVMGQLSSVASGSALAAANLALSKTTTASSIYDTRFVSSNVTDGDILDLPTTTENASFWLAANGKTAGEWVQVDLGSNYQISNVTLFDTHNRGYKDRGTNAFTLALSTDGNTFTDLASGSFSGSQWLDQTAYVIDSLSAVGRYVRFNVLSGRGGQGAGLAEIQVFGSAALVPEPESYAMLLAGLGLMGAVARRRKQK